MVTLMVGEHQKGDKDRGVQKPMVNKLVDDRKSGQMELKLELDVMKKRILSVSSEENSIMNET